MEEKKQAPVAREQEITLTIHSDLYIKLLDLSEYKGLDISSQIKFILWDYFESTSPE